MKIDYKRHEDGQIIPVGWLEYNTKEIKMQFENFDELDEFLRNVELSDGYKILVLIDGAGDEITISRYKDK